MYYNTETQIEITSSKELRNQFPSVSFPKFPTAEQLLELGLIEVMTTHEDYDPETQKLVRQGLVVTDTTAARLFKAVDLTPQELESLRQQSVPHSVSMRQIRLALLSIGLLESIETAVAASDDRSIQIEWDYASEIRRDSESLNAMTTKLGMTSEQVDSVFVVADTL